MLIKNLFLRNFRSFNELKLTFPESGLIITGPNGSGKTNILEAIYYSSVFRSFRERRLKNLIRDGEDSFFIEVDGIFEDDCKRISIGLDKRGERSISLNGIQVQKASQAVQTLEAFFLGPLDIYLISAPPEKRRQQLDIFLSSDREYLSRLYDYQHLLSERNAYLRLGKRDKELEKVQSSMLVQNAAKVWSRRKEYIESLKEHINYFSMYLLDKDLKASIRFNPNIPSDMLNLGFEYGYKEALISSEESDFEQGFTQYGPHRDDFTLLIGDKPLSVYGSQGQIRCIVIGLKLSAARLLKEKAILLLDEIFAELDIDRQKRLIELLKGNSQCFFTTAQSISDPLNWQIYNLVDGSFK